MTDPTETENTAAVGVAGDRIETGVNTVTGRVFIKNRTTGQRVDFDPPMAVAVAVAMSEYVTDDSTRGFVRSEWCDMEGWDDDDD